MKVFDLGCDNEHSFEGWFASAEDFDRQQQAKLVECPVCGSHAVRKLLSAPRLNLGAEAPVEKLPVAQANDASMQAMLLQMARHIQANSEDVGENAGSPRATRRRVWPRRASR